MSLLHRIARLYNTGWWNFKDFLFSTLRGEMIQFNKHIFQMVLGWDESSLMTPTGDPVGEAEWPDRIGIPLRITIPFLFGDPKCPNHRAPKLPINHWRLLPWKSSQPNNSWLGFKMIPGLQKFGPSPNGLAGKWEIKITFLKLLSWKLRKKASHSRCYFCKISWCRSQWVSGLFSMT